MPAQTPLIRVAGDLHIHVGPSATDVTTTILAALAHNQGVIVTELEALQAADAAEAAAITALKTEQATFLTDIAAALAATGVDPAALAPITAAITARVADLQALTSAEQAADPTPPAPVV